MNTMPGNFFSNFNELLEPNNVKIVLASKKQKAHTETPGIFIPNTEMMLHKLNEKAENTIQCCMCSIYIHLLMHMPEDHIVLCIWIFINKAIA